MQSIVPSSRGKPEADKAILTNKALSISTNVQLTGADLTNWLKPLFGEKYIDIVLTHGVQTGDISPCEYYNELCGRVGQSELLVVPIHTRNHWVLAIVTATQQVLQADIYDSAPSIPTQRDIRRLLRSTGIVLKNSYSPRVQPRGSNDCGVHVIVTASCFAVDVSPFWMRGFVSMDRVRRYIRDNEPSAKTAFIMLGLVSPLTVAEVEKRVTQHNPYAPVVVRETIDDALAGGDAHITSPNLVDDSTDHERNDSRSALISRVRTYGAFIDVEVIDILVARTLSQSSTPSDVTYLSGLRLWDVYYREGRPFPIPLRGVIVSFLITAAKDHFAACSLNVYNKQLTVFDSLHGDTCSDVASKLAQSLHDHYKIRFEVIHDKSCPRQTENDCAVHTVNNILRLLQPAHAVAVQFNRRTAGSALESWANELQHDGWDPRSHVSTITEAVRLDDHHFIAPGARPMTQEQVRRTLLNMSIDDVVDVHWSYDVTSADRWQGTLISKKRQEHVIRYSRRLCPDCMLWKEMSEIEAPIPFKETIYYSVLRVPELSESLCVCPWRSSDDDSDSSSNDALPMNALNEANNESEVTDTEEIRRLLFPEERQCNPRLGMASCSGPLGNVGRFWHLYSDRPPHVHVLTWRQYADTTRRHHVRWLQAIKNMPEDLWKVPLPVAVLELVLRTAQKREWKWSTLSGALSSAASALEHLPVYSNCAKPIKLREEASFSAALRRAQHLARITTTKSDISEALGFEQYQRILTDLKDPKALLLFQLAWHFAARLLDISLIAPADISVLEDGSCGVRVAVLFRFGKGARFWGPYTIQSVVPRDVSKCLSWYVNHSRQDFAIFSYRDRRVITEKLKAFGLTSRAIRRGSILHAARAGVSDDNLMLLSGHRRKDTLMRYLGWGYDSASAKQAAEVRAQRLQGGEVKSPIMGPFSGRVGNYGRRTPKPPRFMPVSAPGRKELGLSSRSEDTSQWPLHVKGVSTCDTAVLQHLAQGSELRSVLATAIQWCTQPKLLGDEQEYTPKDVPVFRITVAQKRQLIEAGKLAPHQGPIKGIVKAFLLPQYKKGTLRPIFEPSANCTLRKCSLPKLAYPSRYERRALINGKAFVADFDMAAYFDQIDVSELAEHLVVRVRAGGYDELMHLTRLPMGARFAPFVAQVFTWTLTGTIANMEGVVVLTMLDNVLIASNDSRQFVDAVRGFLARCDEANIQLNDNESWRGSEEQIVRKGLGRTFVFLGEAFCDNTVRNTEECVAKLIGASSLMEQFVQNPDTPYSRRNFASLIGLIIYMTHTVNVSLNSLYTLLRAYSAVIGEANEGPPKVAGWDTQLENISPAVLAQLRVTIQTLSANVPVELPVLRRPRGREEDYQLVCVVDASKVGWGAYVGDLHEHSVFKISGRWKTTVSHSAHAEPAAINNLLHLVRSKWPRVHRIAVMTDHSAIVSAQRGWNDYYGGFSTSYHANELFLYSYETFKIIDFFYIQGDENIADEPSRNPSDTPVFVQTCNITLPSLGACWHPANTEQQRPSYAC